MADLGLDRGGFQSEELKDVCALNFKPRPLSAGHAHTFKVMGGAAGFSCLLFDVELT